MILASLKKAYEYHVKYMKVRDSIRKEKVYEQIADAEAKYQSEKKEKDLLKIKQEKSEADLKISQRNGQLIGIGGTMIVLLLAGGFMFYRNKQNQKNRLVSDQNRRTTERVESGHPSSGRRT